jgi:hypothetical protein
MTDELEPIHCFPTTIYAVKKPEFLDTVRLVVDEYIEKRKLEQGQPNEVYPVHMTDSLLEDPQAFALAVCLRPSPIWRPLWT